MSTLALKGKRVSEVKKYKRSINIFAFAKLPKATVSFVMSVCQSVCTEELGSCRTDFHENIYLKFFFENL
jgi:hypothetical protein